MADNFGTIDAVGEVRSVGSMGSEGGYNGRGPIDNVLPTGIVARGTDVKGSDGFNRGMRAGMSTSRNESKSRRSGGR